jgi:mRNA-degrading endonuclease RelE of RelBE toxin-antitoxin system
MINLTDLQDTFKESFQSSIDEQQINLFNAIMIIFELRKINSEKIKFDYNHGFRVDFKIEELAYDRTISLKFRHYVSVAQTIGQ